MDAANRMFQLNRCEPAARRHTRGPSPPFFSTCVSFIIEPLRRFPTLSGPQESRGVNHLSVFKLVDPTLVQVILSPLDLHELLSLYILRVFWILLVFLSIVVLQSSRRRWYSGSPPGAHGLLPNPVESYHLGDSLRACVLSDHRHLSLPAVVTPCHRHSFALLL